MSHVHKVHLQSRKTTSAEAWSYHKQTYCVKVQFSVSGNIGDDQSKEFLR